ncbi:MAG TPA: hypothetical protein VLH08_03525 [Acidobacteriota bacterium]|nr:hypothetical protein [Acidobacteriota bacterium]
MNRDNCNLSGPSKSYYTIRDDEFQASPKGASPIIGAIIKNSEGFELYFANVLQPGFVGETKLNVPGGQSVRVISAALAAGPIGTSPGAAGVPTNKAFLMYRVLRQQGNTNQTSILLQQLQIQGNTLVTTGSPKTIAPFSETGQPGAQSVHSLALSPNGDFALFTSFDVSCGKETLKYQRLNPNTGAKNGGPITVLNCSNLASTSIGGYAIDLIPTLD